MIVKNVSKNTIFVEDINLHIPYNGAENISFPPNILRKSRDLRSAIVSNLMEIVEHGSEQVEKSIVYLKSLNKNCENEMEEYEENGSGIEVKMKGIFYEAGGYAKVNRYLAKNLSDLGVKVKISPKKGQNHLNSDELGEIIALENTPISKDYISIDSIIPSFSEISSSKYSILYTTIESYTLPQQFIDCCQQYQEIWISSDFGYDVLKKYIKDKPIIIIPTGVDPCIYNENVQSLQFHPPLKSFVFLSVFGWSYRKGYDILFKAYFDAFSDKDDVSLLIFSRYMQSINPVHSKKMEDDIQKYKTKENLPHYKIVSKIVPEKIMPQIYKSCHSFVLSSRGEGSNLPVCEASLCGLPIISTNCSGQTCYLKSDNSFLVEPDKFEKLQPNLIYAHYWDNQVFPAFTSDKSVKDLAGLMRSVYENYSEAKETNKKLQELLLNRFTWKMAAEKAVDRLKLIKERILK